MKNDKTQLRPGATWNETESLNSVLSRLGFTTQSNKLGNYRKIVLLNRRGMFEGNASDVWEWLRKGCPVNSQIAALFTGEKAGVS
jgi:hypothetical protein